MISKCRHRAKLWVTFVFAKTIFYIFQRATITHHNKYNDYALQTLLDIGSTAAIATTPPSHKCHTFKHFPNPPEK